MIIPVWFCLCLCMFAIGFFSLAMNFFGGLLYPGKKQIIRRSVQYLIDTLVKYLLLQLIIITRLEHFIGRSVHCLRQVGYPVCTSNWYWQQWIKRMWWGGSRHISEVTLEHLRVGLWYIALPMGGYDNSHTSPLSKPMPSWRGIIVCLAFQNGRDCPIYVLQVRFETGYHRLVLRISNRYLWDL